MKQSETLNLSRNGAGIPAGTAPTEHHVSIAAPPAPGPEFPAALREALRVAAAAHEAVLELKNVAARERRGLVPAVTVVHETATLLHHVLQQFSRDAARPA